MSLTAGLVDWAVSVIDRLHYAGVFVLMTLESMVFPVPSEGVMPFVGFLAYQGKMDLWVGVTVATLGSILGSLLSYWIGMRLGRPFITRYRHVFLLSEHDLDATERFFKRRGNWAIFIGRYIPVVRHLISLPAGWARMPLKPFLIATVTGAFGWNLLLAYAGYKLASRWGDVKIWLEKVDYAVIALLVAAVAMFVYLHVRRGRRAVNGRGV